MLRPSHLHGMFCADQESRTYHDSCRLGTRRLSILCPGELWHRLHAAALAYWARERGRGTHRVSPSDPPLPVTDCHPVGFVIADAALMA